MASLVPTAIVFAVDMAALGAYEAARRLGVEIGSDLSVIAYDGIPEGQWVSPPLTTFSVDSREAATECSRGRKPTEFLGISRFSREAATAVLRAFSLLSPLRG